MSQKTQYLQALAVELNLLGQVLTKIPDLIRVYQTRGYDALATDPITVPDLAPYGVIVYDVGAAINTLQQLQKLFANQPTTPDPVYLATVDKWRQL